MMRKVIKVKKAVITVADKSKALAINSLLEPCMRLTTRKAQPFSASVPFSNISGVRDFISKSHQLRISPIGEKANLGAVEEAAKFFEMRAYKIVGPRYPFFFSMEILDPRTFDAVGVTLGPRNNLRLKRCISTPLLFSYTCT